MELSVASSAVAIHPVLAGRASVGSLCSPAGSAHGGSSLTSVGLTENLDQVIPEIAMLIACLL